MHVDKNNNEIKLGSKITNGYKGQTYKIIEYKNKLYADNGGNMFPLDSPNINLKKFKVIN
jgi:hypothetical protein